MSSFSIFINFAGNCREAVTYYADVFGKEVPKFMLYKEAPEMGGMEITDEEKDYVMYTSLNIFGAEVMFADNPKSMPLVVGNNISPTLSSKDKGEIEKLYNKLKEEGKVGMELQKTFWSPLYGMIEDKYGVIWQLSYDDGTKYSW